MVFKTGYYPWRVALNVNLVARYKKCNWEWIDETNIALHDLIHPIEWLHFLVLPAIIGIESGIVSQ